MSITSVGQHLIHYEALGRGEPLIFVHGWLGSWRYWWPSMQEMSRYNRTFAFDLWGFGDSSKPAEKYHLDSYVEMLEEFIKELGIVRPVTLVGHGLGAIVALCYSALPGNNVQKLITVALPIQGSYINKRLSNSDSTSLYNRIVGRNGGYPEVQQELRKTDSNAVHSVTQQLVKADFSNDVENLACPLLIIFGEQDQVVEKPSGEYAHFLESTERRAFVNFEACNHFPMLDERAKFSRLIMEFTQSNDNNLEKLSPKDYWQRRTH